MLQSQLPVQADPQFSAELDRPDPMIPSQARNVPKEGTCSMDSRALEIGRKPPPTAIRKLALPQEHKALERARVTEYVCHLGAQHFLAREKISQNYAEIAHGGAGRSASVPLREEVRHVVTRVNWASRPSPGRRDGSCRCQAGRFKTRPTIGKHGGLNSKNSVSEAR